MQHRQCRQLRNPQSNELSSKCLACAQLGWQAGDEGNLLLAEAQGTPKVDRETATQLMFETFNVAGLFIADEPVLSLYAHGKLTGCVIDFGHGKTGGLRSHCGYCVLARRLVAV